MSLVRTLVSFVAAGMTLVLSCRRMPPPATDKHDPITHAAPREFSIVEKATLPSAATLKDGACIRRGALPDPQCTPGKANPHVTAQHICTPGFAKTVHGAPDKLKQKVLAMYGESPSQEIDYLISLELGGSSEIRNLWPERAEPRPGLHEKNKAEDFLRRKVCQGNMTLEEAQRLIAADWMAVFRSIP
jgi:hypothetical protein